MTRLPIRVRLTLVYLVVIAVVLVLLGAFLYVRLGSSLDERIDDELESRAGALASAVRGAGGDVDPSLFAGEEGVAQVIDAGGAVVVASPGAPRGLLTGGELTAARRGTVSVERGELRLRARAADGWIVVVGEPVEDREEALDALLGQLLVVLPIALLVSSGIGYLVAGAALRPVEAMRLRAAGISADTAGTRLPLPRADDEVRRLGETLNGMLERLEAALERERRFAADASHELRTPLALLKAELELALRQPRTPAELEDALRSASVETERLVRLAEDLLLVSRPGGAVTARCTVDAAELLSDVARRFARQAADLGRAIETDLTADASLDGDLAQLERALSNLVENALRHGAGTVCLTAVEQDGRVELHVTDEGPGFPDGFLVHAFERFTRADEARGDGGTGLGLAIADGVARAHGGSAHAANRERGADVWLSLPARLNRHDAAGRARGDVG